MVASIIRAAHVADFSELNNQVGVNWKLPCKLMKTNPPHDFDDTLRCD